MYVMLASGICDLMGKNNIVTYFNSFCFAFMRLIHLNILKKVNILKEKTQLFPKMPH